jgi:hypothetical protein
VEARDRGVARSWSPLSAESETPVTSAPTSTAMDHRGRLEAHHERASIVSQAGGHAQRGVDREGMRRTTVMTSASVGDAGSAFVSVVTLIAYATTQAPLRGGH